MAIINVSPDSFSGDGIASKSALEERLRVALVNGADILDIGGQSTRPGAEIISADAEIERVVPAIKLARRLSAKPISVDTFKPVVARAALAAGATIVNDIHGCADRRMVELIRDTGTSVVVMHSRGTPKTMARLTHYPNGLLRELLAFFRHRTTLLRDAGVPVDQIIIDPGIGFAKTASQSFEVTQHLADLHALGFEVLYGASMKSFLGKALAEKSDEPVPVDKRAIATTVTTTWAILQGADIIRVHDVEAAVQARRVLHCIANPSEVENAA